MKKTVVAVLALIPFALVAHAFCPIPSLTGTADQNKADQRAFEACQQKELYHQDQLQLNQPQGLQQQPKQGTSDFLLDKNMIKKIGASFQESQEHLRQLRAQESEKQLIPLPGDKQKAETDVAH
jgi:hypothetical protein